MLKNTLNAACRLFTAMVVVYSLLILLIYSADPESSLALSAARIFLSSPSRWPSVPPTVFLISEAWTAG